MLKKGHFTTIKAFAKENLKEWAAYAWAHVRRVFELSMSIGSKEKADLEDVMRHYNAMAFTRDSGIGPQYSSP